MASKRPEPRSGSSSPRCTRRESSMSGERAQTALLTDHGLSPRLHAGPRPVVDRCAPDRRQRSSGACVDSRAGGARAPRRAWRRRERRCCCVRRRGGRRARRVPWFRRPLRVCDARYAYHWHGHHDCRLCTRAARRRSARSSPMETGQNGGQKSGRNATILAGHSGLIAPLGLLPGTEFYGA